MRITIYSSLIIIILAHIILPAVILLWVWRGRNSSRFEWLLKIVITFPVIITLFLVGYWQQFTYYARIIIMIAYLAAVYKSWLDSRILPLYTRLIYVDWILIIAGLGISVAMVCNLMNIFESYSYKGTPVNLTFPFKNGPYMICFGGNGEKSALANYHYKFPLYSRTRLDPSVIYAVDIVKLNVFGKSAKGFMPFDNHRYEIFLETVYSPCDGTVVSIENKWPDEKPYAYDYPYNPGNSIVIRYENVYVLMGHLEKDSFLVKTGDSVARGEPLAKSGNSGWTTEPHLHIQVMRTYDGVDNEGEGLPFLFDGRFPVKNDLFIKP